jgi:hypothetical protein
MRDIRLIAAAINTSNATLQGCAARVTDVGYRQPCKTSLDPFRDFAMTLALLQHLAMMSSKMPAPPALMLVFRDWRDLK